VTWKKFLAALVAGGWSTDVVSPWADEVLTCSTRDGQVIEAEWRGIGLKFAGVSIDGTSTNAERLAEVLGV